MGNNEPGVDQSDLRIRGSYGLNTVYTCIIILIQKCKSIMVVATDCVSNCKSYNIILLARLVVSYSLHYNYT